MNFDMFAQCNKHKLQLICSTLQPLYIALYLHNVTSTNTSCFEVHGHVGVQGRDTTF
jgi:hypothetical protein